MPTNLPPILPSGSRENTPFLSSSRSQAKVSVSQVRGDQGPVTSIANVNRGSVSAMSSINRPAQASEAQKSDDLRYGYVQRRIKARNEKEARAAKFAGKPVAGQKATAAGSKPPTTKEAFQKKFTLKMGTGASFHRGLRGGLNKTLLRMRRQYRSTLSNLQPKDLRFIGDIISKHAKYRSTGSGYGFSDKRNMKIEVERARQAGKISYLDAKSMKRMMDLLE